MSIPSETRIVPRVGQHRGAGEGPSPGAASDPVLDALARCGIEGLVAPTDTEVRAVLYRLAGVATSLGPIDRVLLDSEAAQRLGAIGVARAGDLVAAAIAVGERAVAAAVAADRPTASSTDAKQPVPDVQSLVLLSLAELLADPSTLKPPEAVVPRIAYRGRVTLVVGREKLGGKSTLLTAGAAAVTRGGEFLSESCTAGDVLWVTADQEHAGEIAQRAVRFGADPTRFHVLWPREPFADLTAALERVAPDLLVIDTLANFARVDDPHSSAEWPAVLLPLVRLAREGDLAIVIAHHATKAENGGYRDSTAIGATVDLILELHRDGDGPRRRVVALGRWPLAGFTVELTGNLYQLVTGGELSLDAQVLAFVQANPRACLSAVRSVGGRHENVEQALGRLLASGAVRNEGRDRRHAYVAASTPPAGKQLIDTSEDDDPPF